ncbi:FixQ cytochrome c oxidase [Candidatus Endolissoclinum faulkneri L5]|uniref:FixQ cytochrome c oxidase n=1 Tax=Candidatus Endolissoclinum faulkneri L5 TaxID=1401328 RepID=V9TU56_9PROT|nr:cbb3-type cytochrome c oxidase subunit 3 [Candidatus Endolissoclinum faulkneri]AHC73672.1 FixQ cytochrome c oxidase [Candidatus Endolissoclinum faulkneri L5]
MTYDNLRQIADSWGILYIVAMFLAVVAYTFRSSGRKRANDAAFIPLNEDLFSNREENQRKTLQHKTLNDLSDT